ncbi:type II toxin-antitoxin system toxin DNA ADP-ribosyl transferase DarT [Burkholderia sp. AW49-1]
MANHYPNLNPEKALIWRIVHRDNLPWILDNGVHCKRSAVQDPNYVAIGNADLIDRRSHRVVPVAPGGMLSNYVPFYFTPFSPMMYNIYTGRGEVAKRRNEEICILVSTLHKVHQMGLSFVFTDRHAYPPLARYFNSVDSLNEIDWPLLQARNFKRNPDDPEQIERYQAEALVHNHLPVTGLVGIICYTDAVKSTLDRHIQARGLKMDVRVMPRWYF